MNFMGWLVTQRSRYDLVGEVAQQIGKREWPESDDLLVLRVRLALEAASPVAYRALTLAWEEWAASRHLPVINMKVPKGEH